MQSTSKLADEILAEVKTMKKVAESNAVKILQEHFAPAVHELISNQLRESELQEDDEMEYEDQLDAPAPDAIPDGGVEMEDDMEDIDAPPADVELDTDIESDEDFEEDSFDFDSIDFDAILADLGGELPEVPEVDANVEFEDDTDFEFEDDLEESADYIDDGDDGTPAGSNLSEIIDEVLAEIEEESCDTDDVLTDQEELVKENKKLKDVILKQKKMMKEVNLLNSKLMYSVKISNLYPDLTTEQKVALLQQIDKADTVKEVELVSETIIAKHNTKKKTAKRTKVDEAKKTYKRRANARRSRLSENRSVGSSSNQFNPRWLELAGISGK